MGDGVSRTGGQFYLFSNCEMYPILIAARRLLHCDQLLSMAGKLLHWLLFCLLHNPQVRSHQQQRDPT